jgi:hypothetical protein
MNRVNFSQLDFCSKTPPSCEKVAYTHTSVWLSTRPNEHSLPLHHSLDTPGDTLGRTGCEHDESSSLVQGWTARPTEAGASTTPVLLLLL